MRKMTIAQWALKYEACIDYLEMAEIVVDVDNADLDNLIDATVIEHYTEEGCHGASLRIIPFE